jgi:hypothetical protein
MIVPPRRITIDIFKRITEESSVYPQNLTTPEIHLLLGPPVSPAYSHFMKGFYFE